MSLLDDARRLAETKPFVEVWDNMGGHFECWACDTEGSDAGDHAPDCPLLAMPQIMMVLEVVDIYVQEMEGQGDHVDVLKRVRAYRTLAAALKGEKVTT